MSSPPISKPERRKENEEAAQERDDDRSGSAVAGLDVRRSGGGFSCAHPGSSHAASSAAQRSGELAGPAKPVVRVNGAVLTDRDLAREIQMIFPYEKTHDGIPKGMEPEMRKGAMQMMVFEELVYQEALRRKMTVAPQRMKESEARFRQQFASDEEFQKVMEIEVHGSPQLMREKIRRSLLIEELLKSDVTDKAAVSEVEARDYYSRNAKKFQHGELFSLQTISIIPPGDANPDARKKPASTLRMRGNRPKRAKATRNLACWRKSSRTTTGT